MGLSCRWVQPLETFGPTRYRSTSIFDDTDEPLEDIFLKPLPGPRSEGSRLRLSDPASKARADGRRTAHRRCDEAAPRMQRRHMQAQATAQQLQAMLAGSGVSATLYELKKAASKARKLTAGQAQPAKSTTPVAAISCSLTTPRCSPPRPPMRWMWRPTRLRWRWRMISRPFPPSRRSCPLSDIRSRRI